MANYNFMNKGGNTAGGKFGNIKVDDKRGNQGFAITRTEVYEEHVTVSGPNRNPFPRGLFQRQMPNNPQSNSVTSIEGATKDVGVGKQSRQTGGDDKDIDTNGPSNPTKDSTNNFSNSTYSKVDDKGSNQGSGSITTTTKPTGDASGGVDPVKEAEVIDSNKAAQMYNGYIAPNPRKAKVIDSNEAAKMYNGYIAPNPQRAQVIDSNEAARKYKGTIEPNPQKAQVMDSNEAARKYKGVLAPNPKKAQFIDSNEAAHKYKGAKVP